MATLIIEMDGGLVNEVYSTLWSRSTFKSTTPMIGEILNTPICMPPVSMLCSLVE